MFALSFFALIVFAFILVESQPSTCNYKTQDECQQHTDDDCVWYVDIATGFSPSYVFRCKCAAIPSSCTNCSRARKLPKGVFDCLWTKPCEENGQNQGRDF
jgi:hypothetical protein